MIITDICHTPTTIDNHSKVLLVRGERGHAVLEGVLGLLLELVGLPVRIRIYVCM